MKKITVAEFKAGATLPEPIYMEKPYIILNKDGVVLAAGSLDYLKADVIISRTSYYDDFEITARALGNQVQADRIVAACCAKMHRIPSRAIFNRYLING